MTSRFTTISAALGCVVLASCYPYDEGQRRTPAQQTANKTVTSPDQQKIQQQRDEIKKKEEAKKEETANQTTTPPVNNTAPSESPKPKAEEKRDYAYAAKVPGKEGFVFSPYNNKVVDVRDIPSGTLVQDPTYTGAGKGYFRVP